MTLAASVNSARDRSFLSAIFEKLLRSRSSAVFWARYRRTIYLAANIIATNILSRVLKRRFAQEVPRSLHGPWPEARNSAVGKAYGAFHRDCHVFRRCLDALSSFGGAFDLDLDRRRLAGGDRRAAARALDHRCDCRARPSNISPGSFPSLIPRQRRDNYDNRKQASK
jgi:hypothetical protein